MDGVSLGCLLAWPGSSRFGPCQSTGMNEVETLRVERALLEFRLVMLEQAIEAQRLEGVESPELAECMTAVFAQLRQVNTKLAELRVPPAST